MAKATPTPTPIMTADDEKFMALEGLVQWAKAVLVQASRISEATSGLVDPSIMPSFESRRLAIHRVHTECHFFVTAAHKLLEYRDWCLSFGLCSTVDFSEIDLLSGAHIKDLRNMREHIVEYFRGEGRSSNRWVISTPEYSADASSLQGTLIGGRLDWLAFSKATERIIPRLLAEPIPFSPAKSLPPHP